MIDLFAILHRGGAVLFKRELARVPGRPLDALVAHLLEQRGAEGSSIRHEDKYTIRWVMDNELQLLFVGVHLNLGNLLYVEPLLEEAKSKFSDKFRAQALAIEPPQAFAKFSRHFEDLVAKYEGGGATTRGGGETELTTPNKQPAHGKKKPAATPEIPQGNTTDEDSATGTDGDGEDSVSTPLKKTDAGNAASPEIPSSAPGSGVNQAKLAALQNAARSGGVGGKPVHAFGKKKKPSTGGSMDASSAPASADAAPAKKGKVARTWDGAKASKAEAKALDYTRVIDGEDAAEAAAAANSTVSGFDSNPRAVPSQADLKDKYSGAPKPEYSSDEDEGSDSEDADEDKPAAAASSGGGLFSYFKTLVAGKVLERSDLEPVLVGFKNMLNGKNVAAEISEKLAESVIQSLVGQKLQSFSSIKSLVKRTLEEALTRILTPNRQIDVLAGVVEANEQQRPYSIVFVGVNGVGKSTSLAKTASYFLSKNLTVGVAACDTFRAGAIEQLRTHTKALNIPLYARGYDRDAASVAQDAIAQARRDGLNVVLVDTAGRMQHNEPLMRALAKLITLNRPDLVLFVGEALVGNDAVDQVSEFNRALSDMSEEKKPRLIDAIILTKFDTIDDKVGAAISMAYVTGQPILFVGTGQTYKDLKRMNVKTLIRALLK